MRLVPRPPANVPAGVAAALLALGVAQVATVTTWSGGAAHRTAQRIATSPIPSAAATTVVPTPMSSRRPAVRRSPQSTAVLVGLQAFGSGVTSPGPGRVIAVRPAGSERPRSLSQPMLPSQQRSAAASEEVLTRLLSASSSEQSGCGVAGCSQSTIVRTEQGLVLAGLHGEHPRLVTRGGFDSEPSFSPDGRFVVYVSHRAALFQNQNVAVDVIAWMTASGRDLGVLVAPRLDGSTAVGDPVWRPDSGAIAFERTLSGGSAAAPRAQLVELVLRSRRQHVIASTLLRDIAWSPDGTTIAGVRDRLVRLPGSGPAEYVASGGELWLVSVRTGRARQLTHLSPPAFYQTLGFCGEFGGAIPELRQPAWSPDSTTIAVATSYGHLDDLARSYDVAVVNARSGRARTIYRVDRLRCPGGSTGYTKEVGTQAMVLGWQ
jgi:hypothetical protein